MITTEKVQLNGKEFTLTKSDAGFMIRKVGTNEVYSEAYDILDYQYEETNKKIEEPAV